MKKEAPYKVEQRKFREMTKPKFHVKGAKVTVQKYLGRKKGWEEREMVNAQPSHYIQVGTQLVRVNRRRARARSVDRSHTSRGYEFGVRIGSKQHKLIKHHENTSARLRGRFQPSPELERHRANVPTPTHDPTKTNHQRMLERKEARDARREAERQKRKAEVATSNG